MRWEKVVRGSEQDGFAAHWAVKHEGGWLEELHLVKSVRGQQCYSPYTNIEQAMQALDELVRGRYYQVHFEGLVLADRVVHHCTISICTELPKDNVVEFVTCQPTRSAALTLVLLKATGVDVVEFEVGTSKQFSSKELNL